MANITLLFTDIGKSYSSCEFLTSQTCFLTLFTKIKFSQIFTNLQYTEALDKISCLYMYKYKINAIFTNK